MNLMLLQQNSVQENGSVKVIGRQAKHLVEILKVEEHSTVRIGIDNTWVGVGKVIQIAKNIVGGDSVKSTKHSQTCPDNYEVTFQLLHGNGIDEPINQSINSSSSVYTTHRCGSEFNARDKHFRPIIDVIIGMPRPKLFDKILQTLATLGVGRIFITPTLRVETAYFSSPKLSLKGIEEALRLGLEQAGSDPLFPEVYIYASWKRCLNEIKDHFIISSSDAHTNDKKDINDTIQSNSGHKLIVLHPDDTAPFISSSIALEHHLGPVMIAIGPEGGFIDNEINDLQTIGFNICQLGTRILKVETAIITAITQINMLLPKKDTTSTYQFQRHDIKPLETQSCWCLTESTCPLQIHLPIKGRRL